MTPFETEQTRSVAAAERWFVDNGLPYFVDDLRNSARLGLSRQRFLPVVGLSLLVGAAGGVGLSLASGDNSNGVIIAIVLAGLVITAYAAARLHLMPMARWAVGHTFGSLGLLFPLATRALPLLLLFVTFLFINTEVWQVASSLDGGILWGAVLLFAAMATGFLLARLPEELDQVDDNISGARLLTATAGTPLEAEAKAYADVDLTAIAQVRTFEKGNLVLVLLISQAVQVLLLSLAVFGFFVIFGSVAIRGDVMRTWLGTEPRWLFDNWKVPSVELFQVSTFLAAFSGLYFTVYAVSDETYRRQFFASLERQLERAVAVRAVYQSIRRG